MRERGWICLLVAVEAAAVAAMWQSYAIPVAAAAIAAVACVGRFRWKWRASQRAGIAVAGAVVVLARWIAVPGDTHGATSPLLDTSLCRALAEGLLVFQALWCYGIWSRHDRGLFYLAGILALVFGGNAFPAGNALGSATFNLAVLVFGAVLAALLATKGRDRPRGYGVVLVLVAAITTLAWGTSFVLARYGNELDPLISGFLTSPRAGVGLSRHVRLGNVVDLQMGNPDGVALRVVSETEPGYVRVYAREQYRRGTWVTAFDKTPLPVLGEAASLEFGEPDLRVFALPLSGQIADLRDLQRFVMWPGNVFGDAIPALLGGAYVAGRVETVVADAHDMLESRGAPPEPEFVVLAAAPVPVTPLSVEVQQRCSAVPDGLDPRIASLAEKLFLDCPDTAARVSAVEQYFRLNYRYALGMKISDDEEPLAYFLLHEPRPAAHCEYFAAGAAVLLRLAGVPTRYVTGFVVQERNDRGDYWIARNKDAHAWVEAYDPTRGWTTVEATPAAGVPSGETRGFLAQTWDGLFFQWRRIRSALAVRGIRGLMTAIPRPVFGAVALVLGVGLTLLLGRQVRRRAGRTASPHEASLVRGMRRLLSVLDKQLKRQGLSRDEAETLHGFAQRIEQDLPGDPWGAQAAGWYRAYACARYRGDTDESVLHDLRSRLP